jgi:predicted dithiol-disulfide oxidoreductase (DUF899 family)
MIMISGGGKMMTITASPMHKVVSREEWLRARQDLLAKEKALTRQYDVVAASRRALPWVKVEKNYLFDTLQGKRSLADLFDGRTQLIIRHFMFGPDWKEGCVGCSFASDHVGGALVHLRNHDVTYVAVSRTPLNQIEQFRERMGWSFRWVSSFGGDFNFDYHVSFTKEQLASDNGFYNYQMTKESMEELSGLSVFSQTPAGEIFHTYSTFARGDEGGDTAYFYLDITPKGRNETVRGNLTDWVRHHDRYRSDGYVDTTGRYRDGSKKEERCHE